MKVQPESGFFSSGVSASIPFVVMLVFLIAYSFSAKGLRTEAFEVDRRSAGGVHGDAPPLPPARGWKRAIGPLAMAVVLAALPLLFDNVTIVRHHVRPVLGGRVRAGHRAGDHLPLLHAGHR